jgi:hypothetical protein
MKKIERSSNRHFKLFPHWGDAFDCPENRKPLQAMGGAQRGKKEERAIKNSFSSNLSPLSAKSTISNYASGDEKQRFSLTV